MPDNLNVNAKPPRAVAAVATRDDILADGWFVPPVVVPILFAAMIAARAFWLQQ
jgi:hypothetical protein